MEARVVSQHGLRVLYVIPGTGEGFSMVFVRRQIPSLESLGVTVRLFFLASRTSMCTVFREAFRLRREIQRVKPDLVHAHFGTVTGLLSVIASRTPVVVTFRGSDLNPTPSSHPLKSALARMFSQVAGLLARKCICVTQRLRCRLWLRRDRAHVIPSGVDLDLFQPIARDEPRRLLGWPSDQRVVLFNAARRPGPKGLPLVEAAILQARLVLPDIRLEILDGDVEPKRIPTLLSAADCLALASDWEGSPNIVKEALACNLPVVSVDVGDVRERLVCVIPSRIVRRSPEEMAAALVDILRVPTRSNGRDQVASLSTTSTAQEIARLYRDAARSR